MKNKAVLIIGQTASGKTALAHKICETLQEKTIVCEIVNLDAFQIYKNVSVGTAKPSSEEQIKYRYHGIDLCNADETMDANVFAAFAHKACKEISAKGRMPVCVGGSGLYLRAFLHGLDKFPSHDPEIRQQIRNYAQKQGWEKCYEWLVQVDPVRATELHPNDHVRVERALEIFEITKMPASAFQTKKTPLFAQDVHLDSYVIHTVRDNDALRKNILNRTTELFQKGWVEEVQMLYQKYGDGIWNLNSMRAIGYRAVLSFLGNTAMSPRSLAAAGLTTTEQLIAQISHETAKYAKRQKTWNKKERADFLIHPENGEEYKELIANLANFMKRPMP